MRCVLAGALRHLQFLLPGETNLLMEDLSQVTEHAEHSRRRGSGPELLEHDISTSKPVVTCCAWNILKFC